jgi:hypothetical protein
LRYIKSVFLLDRLTSRSSRSLAVMLGSGRSAKANGRESLRGSPDAAFALRPAVFLPAAFPPSPKFDISA